MQVADPNRRKPKYLRPKRNHKGYNKVSMVDPQDNIDLEDDRRTAPQDSNPMEEGIPNCEDNNPMNAFLKSSHPLLPFVVLLVLKLLFDARIELFLCIALLITCYKTDCLFLELTGFRKTMERQIRAAQLGLFLVMNLFLILLVYSDKSLHSAFIFMKPNIDMDIFHVVFYAALVDFIIKMFTMCIKCAIYSVPSRVFPSTLEDKGWLYLTVELVSQFYRTLVPPALWIHMFLDMHGTSQYIFNIILIILAVIFKAFQLKPVGQSLFDQCKTFGKETYHAMPVESSSTICPICLGPFNNSVITGACMHIFCHKCLAAWCNRDKKCPICKEELVKLASVEYRDGHTGQYLQLF